MEKTEREKPIMVAVEWLDNLLVLIALVLIFYYLLDANWLFIILLTLFIIYPYCCFHVQKVKFYQDRMVIIRPFLIFRTKKIVPYDQIEYICDFISYFNKVREKKGIFCLFDYDLYVYVKNKKQLMGIPMPFAKQKRKKLMDFIASKEIHADWGRYEKKLKVGCK